MQITLKTSQITNLEKIQQIRSIIEKNIDVHHLNIKNLEPEELHDYQKILQIFVNIFFKKFLFEFCFCSFMLSCF